MAEIKIDKERCKGCGLCIIFCPQAHIKTVRSMNKAGYRPVVFSKEGSKDCTGCCACAIICPEAAIEVYK